jgi:3-oxoacyl-[acyl-carrier-protein] synthase I
MKLSPFGPRRSQVPIRLSALGMINALGGSLREIEAGLFQGSTSRIVESSDFLPDRGCRVGLVESPLPTIPPELSFLDSRNSRLLFAAYEQIKDEIHVACNQFGPARFGIVIGSSTSGIEQGEKSLANFQRTGKMSESFRYTQQEMGAPSELLRHLTTARGPSYTISTACSSSAKAFRSAKLLLEHDLCDAVLVGGADCLCQLTVQGFASLELLSGDLANPFSKSRDGINIGEGAALFVLTRERGGVQLLGVGEASDAYHMSSPDPEARGAIAAIQSALEDAVCCSKDIHYLNLHGTGTIHNDAMEARAVSEGLNLRRGSPIIPASSTKPLVGHMLGAAGATEIGFCWLSLRNFLDSNGIFPIPPHIYDGEYDGSLPLISLSPLGATISGHTTVRCLSNSFGFGGSNCAVIVGASLEEM